MRLEYGPPARMAAALEELEPELGLVLGTWQRSRLLDYLALIQHWTKVYNLTAVRNTSEMFTHHLLDCLAIVIPMRRGMHRSGDEPLRVLDVGSGAGLPGVILALLNPAWQVTCVDAVAKKTAFIRQCAAELSLPNLHAVHGRVESAKSLDSASFDLITSRAFASIKDFTSLTRRLLAQDAVWAAMKGKLSDGEVEEIPSDVEMFHVEQLKVPQLDAARSLIWLRPSILVADMTSQP